MALRINTNVAALNAHLNMKKTDNAMSQSLGRLSTGLRINKAADDASGLAIADSLKSQGAGLGQAIKNANDGISIVQTADGALQEATNIVNTIKTKAIQAAQDGQTFASRKIIQKDISKLLEEVDLLASTTSFNGKKLLSGEFTNKSFQVGAGTRETVGISIKSAETSKVGHVTTANLKVLDKGNLSLKIHSNEQDKDFTLQAVDMQYNNSAQNGIGALANIINANSDQTGISAQAVVQSNSAGQIEAGKIGADFTINGISMGDIDVAAGDNTGTLQAAINQKADQTGVTASINQGVLTLNSADGRGIEVKGNISHVLGKSSEDMTTFGELKITQTGSNSLLIDDSDAGELTKTDLTIGGANVTTSHDMLISDTSTIGNGTVLAAGSELGFELTTVDSGILIKDATIVAGSTLASGTEIAAGTILGGDFRIEAETLKNDEVLKEGSIIKSGSTIGKGTVLTVDVVTACGTLTAGSTLAQDTVITEDALITKDMEAKENTALLAGSTLGQGTQLSQDIETDNTTGSGPSTVNETFTLKTDSDLGGGSVLAVGSTLGKSETLGAAVASGSTTGDTTLAAGSTLATATVLKAGSTVGAEVTLSGGNVTLSGGSMTLSAGSVIASGSILAKGTFLTADVTISGAAVSTIKAGTILKQNITTATKTYLNDDMTVAKDTVLNEGTKVASAGGGTESDISIEDSKVTRLQDVDVTTQEGAQTAIAVADSALAAYNDIRSDLGSTQNQLTSTISNISVTQINVASAESAIRDVDFAAESQNFSKLQILAQSGSYAMSQANSASQTVMSLLQ